MSLSRKIADLMTFALPPDWHESKPSPDDQSPQSALDELTSSLTFEALRAIAPHLESSREQAAIDCELAPEQYAAAPDWNTPDNLATLSIFADVVFYTNLELGSTDDLLQSQSSIPAKEVTQAGRSIFSMWYSNRGRLGMSASDPEELPATATVADPALLEAFYEMKATLERAGGDIESDFKVISAYAGQLAGKPAAIVETEHYFGGIIEKQTGYHLLLDREKHGGDWRVQEVRILMRCTPANADYVQPEFQSILDSIRWLPAGN